ncbi:MAG: YHYH protein [Candidatus Phaeomarinobacter sp.]
MKSVLRPSARSSLIPAMALILAAGMIATAAAQIGQRTRAHTTLQSDGDVDREPADTNPPGTSRFTMEVVGDERRITANGIPNHAVGHFPSSGNPHRISTQSYNFVLNATPLRASRTTSARGYPFGIAVSGVVFDPGAAEWYQGQRGPWQYEPLSGAISMGVDANNAHVQPDGSYHYHGLPMGLMNELGLSRDTHSALVGWAADGFPIYAKYGHLNGNDAASPIIQHRSSYTLKQGTRQPIAGGRGGTTPGGYYDGTFVADYEYVAGHGTLDECNGTVTITPEFPDGTYAYFLTADWPVIPRCFAGTPSSSFTSLRPGRGGQGGPGGNRAGGPPNGDRFGRPPPRL